MTFSMPAGAASGGSRNPVVMSSPGTRTTLWLRYLHDTWLRYLGDTAALTGAPFGGGEGAVLLGRVVAGGMHPDHLAFHGELHRVACGGRQ